MNGVYANLICQNGVGDIMRAIGSLYFAVDKILICDGGSDDGTLELLNRYKDAYDLEIYQRPFDNMENQRNFLLDKTPDNSWVVSVDQDEELNYYMSRQLHEFLTNIVPGHHYTDTERELPLALRVPFLNLCKTPFSFNNIIKEGNNIMIGCLGTKVFYKDRNINWHGEYHSIPKYDKRKKNLELLEAPNNWAIYHYAFLDKDRLDNAEEDIKNGKRDYSADGWAMSVEQVYQIPRRLL